MAAAFRTGSRVRECRRLSASLPFLVPRRPARSLHRRSRREQGIGASIRSIDRHKRAELQGTLVSPISIAGSPRRHPGFRRPPHMGLASPGKAAGRSNESMSIERRYQEGILTVRLNLGCPKIMRIVVIRRGRPQAPGVLFSVPEKSRPILLPCRKTITAATTMVRANNG